MIATLLVEIHRTKGKAAEPGDFFPSLRREKPRPTQADLQAAILRSFGYDPDKIGRRMEN